MSIKYVSTECPSLVLSLNKQIQMEIKNFWQIEQFYKARGNTYPITNEKNQINLSKEENFKEFMLK